MSKKIELGWSESVILVCDKCGKQFDNEKMLEAPTRIKNELKQKSKSVYGHKVRILTTSCLNICPTNKIAIVKATNLDSEVFKPFEVDPDIKTDELFDLIFDQ